VTPEQASLIVEKIKLFNRTAFDIGHDREQQNGEASNLYEIELDAATAHVRGGKRIECSRKSDSTSLNIDVIHLLVGDKS
jgi:hypothetical protein